MGLGFGFLSWIDLKDAEIVNIEHKFKEGDRIIVKSKPHSGSGVVIEALDDIVHYRPDSTLNITRKVDVEFCELETIEKTNKFKNLIKW